MAHPPRIVLSAGEASGDRLGAGLARALLRRRPELELVGMGGAQMEQAGVRRVQDADEVAVVGLFEVLRHLPALRRAMARLTALLDRGADLIVPIDYQDFNMRLAAKAKQRGVPVVYFVSPQVWAWRPGRVEKVRKLVRRILVLFPFEVAFYEKVGVPVDFVGHPIVELPTTGPDRATLCRTAGLDAERPIVALMPGSRRGELERLLPPMLDAARRLIAHDARLQFLLPLAPALDPLRVEALRVEAGDGVPPVAIHRGDFPQLLEHCEAGVVASGTASLEAASMRLPIVVVYKVGGLSYALARRMVKLENVALPNLVAGQRVVPELIQDACSGEAIAAEIRRYLDDPQHAAAVRETLRQVRERLGEPGIYDRAADAVLQVLDDESQLQSDVMGEMT